MPVPGANQHVISEDLRRNLQDHGIAFREAKSDKGVKLQLEECPFNPDHRAPDSFVAQYDNGMTIFSCSHDSSVNTSGLTFEKGLVTRSEQKRLSHS